jgi:hypothetical protein
MTNTTVRVARTAPVTPGAVCGSAFGLLAAIQSFGNLAASGIADLLWTLGSPFAAFAFAAGAMAIAMVSAIFITGVSRLSAP